MPNLFIYALLIRVEIYSSINRDKRNVIVTFIKQLIRFFLLEQNEYFIMHE